MRQGCFGETVQVVETETLHPSPIQHERLDPTEEVLARYTHGIAGKYVQPTLEQWELGFMRDAAPKSELALWVVFSDALESWCRDNPHATEEQKSEAVGLLCGFSMVGMTDDEDTSDDLERRYLDARQSCNETIERVLSQHAAETALREAGRWEVDAGDGEG